MKTMFKSGILLLHVHDILFETVLSYQVAHPDLAPQALLDHLVHLVEMGAGLDQLMWANTLQSTFRVSYVFYYFG